MFLRNKSTIIFIALALIVIAGGIWYTQKPAPKTPPTGNNTRTLVVDKNEIDMSGWVEYRNEKLGFSIKHPADYMFKEWPKDPKDSVSSFHIAGCFRTTNEDGTKTCADGNDGAYVQFRFDTNFKGGTSLEGFRFTEATYEAALGKKPTLEDLRQISVNGETYYQAQYFGGDSGEREVYIPRKDGLMMFIYNVYPEGNDPNTVYNEQLVKTILSTLRLNK